MIFWSFSGAGVGHFDPLDPHFLVSPVSATTIELMTASGSTVEVLTNFGIRASGAGLFA